MKPIAQVIVNVPGIDAVYDYLIPENLSNIMLGSLVIVPFGKQRVQAVVLELIDESSYKDLKTILGVLDANPVLNKHQIGLAHWMAEENHSSLSDCVRLMLPVGISQLSDVEYRIVNKPDKQERFSKIQQTIINEIERRNSLRSRQIQVLLPRSNWKSSVRALIKKGILEGKPILPDPKIHRKTIRTAQIAVSREELENSLGKIGKSKHVIERRKAALDFLLHEGIPVNVSWVYAASSTNNADLKYLEEKGLISLGEDEIWRDPLAHIEVDPAAAPTLTKSQVEAVQTITNKISDSSSEPILIHGVTGSGKTELYLRAVEACLKKGKQCLILVPEISLTPQTVQRFMARFPGKVGLVHSRLSVGERYDTWLRARSGKLSIIIGPRSALFQPLPNIGLIVIDEFHDQAFYQSGGKPFYHAVKSAITYADQMNSAILLGSATPDISTYFKAQSSGWTILTLPHRILAHSKYIQTKNKELSIRDAQFQKDGSTAVSLPLPLVQVVDMREELRQTNNSIFSRTLVAGLRSIVEKKQQAILFLNRRGSATAVFCRTCGYVIKCPRCEIPLTAHHNRLNCHYCGYARKYPDTCPECGQATIGQHGIGTQRVEEELQSILPSARVLRWDADSARQKGAEELLLSHFSNHHADILIGTQMLAKGLDLPLVTLVGIVLADIGLNFPDFKAAERNFQVLTQVAGRSGRSPLGGRVILQSYQPQHYVIQRAARHDFQGFYEDEIIHRREFSYPPFTKLLRLEYRDTNEQSAIEKSKLLYSQLRERMEEHKKGDIRISGPVPPFFEKVRGFYRRQIILRGDDPDDLIKGLTLNDWRVETDPPNLL